ncbi:MAG TPA: hypothetical protein ENI69_05455 [Rhodospirillales bacterium]|nr:hypothetical protein [Rhodospirillales bacterium]
MAEQARKVERARQARAAEEARKAVELERSNKRGAERLAGLAEEKIRMERTRVSRLLALAEADLSDNRLLAPEGNNAFERYKEILSIDKANQQALAGISAIVKRYLQLSATAIGAGLYTRADKFLQKAERVSPDDIAILEARRKLKLAIDNAKNEQISALLASAKSDIRANRLTSPPEKNAYERYQQVLAMDSSNAEALLGLDLIVKRYVAISAKFIVVGKFKSASRMLDRAEKISPGNTIITNARSSLKAAIPASEMGTQGGEMKQGPGNGSDERITSESQRPAPSGMVFIRKNNPKGFSSGSSGNEISSFFGGLLSGQRRVLRGGSWTDSPEHIRTSYRYNYPAVFRNEAFGFHCAT